jgi:hypothetical protein
MGWASGGDLGLRDGRQLAEPEVLPVVNLHWERGELPFELVTKVAALNIAGDTMVGYGMMPMSAVGSVPELPLNGRGSIARHRRTGSRTHTRGHRRPHRARSADCPSGWRGGFKPGDRRAAVLSRATVAYHLRKGVR